MGKNALLNVSGGGAQEDEQSLASRQAQASSEQDAGSKAVCLFDLANSSVVHARCLAPGSAVFIPDLGRLIPHGSRSFRRSPARVKDPLALATLHRQTNPQSPPFSAPHLAKKGAANTPTADAYRGSSYDIGALFRV